jgi:hypothetical protein
MQASCIPRRLHCAFPQVGQQNIGSIALNQSLLSVLARTSALLARQASAGLRARHKMVMLLCCDPSAEGRRLGCAQQEAFDV